MNYFSNACKDIAYMPRETATNEIMKLVDTYEALFEVSFTEAYDIIYEMYADALLEKLK